MQREILTPDEVALILRSADVLKNARIFEGSTQRPFQVQAITLDLTTARLSTEPFKIGFPFKSLYVQSATDVLVSVDIRIGTLDSLQSAFSIKQNDAFNSDYQVSEAYLSWSAQSGKSITLILFTDASFQSGSQISVTGGGVSLVEGSTSTTANTLLTAATPTVVFTANSSRKMGVVQNNSGASLWFGGASVDNSVTGANLGYELAAGGIFQWRNTGILYVYSAAGGRILTFEES